MRAVRSRGAMVAVGLCMGVTCLAPVLPTASAAPQSDPVYCDAGIGSDMFGTNYAGASSGPDYARSKNKDAMTTKVNATCQLPVQIIVHAKFFDSMGNLEYNQDAILNLNIPASGCTSANPCFGSTITNAQRITSAQCHSLQTVTAVGDLYSVSGPTIGQKLGSVVFKPSNNVPCPGG